MKQACQTRGLDYKDFSSAKTQMEQWLQLSLGKGVPPSLLILSSAFVLLSSQSGQKGLKEPVSRKVDTTPEPLLHEALQKILPSLPEQLLADTQLSGNVKNASDMQTKLASLQNQLNLIKEEEKERREKDSVQQEKIEYTSEQMKVVSEAISQLFASIPSLVKKERGELSQLKASLENHQKKEQPIDGASDSLKNALESKLGGMIQRLEGELDLVDQKAKALMSIIDLNHDGHISFEEFSHAVSHLKTKYTQEDISQMFKRLDKNNDGLISLQQLESIYM